MKALFIHSILEHDYTKLMNELLIVVMFWAIVFFAMVADLIAGINKARLRKELRTSYGFKRTVNKFIMYFSALMLSFLIDCAVEYVIVSFNSFIPRIPYATVVISLYIIIFVEGRSILEKAGDKQRKQISEDILKTLDFIDKIKDREVLEYLQKMAKENKSE